MLFIKCFVDINSTKNIFKKIGKQNGHQSNMDRLGGQSREAVKRPLRNDKDVGSNPAATRRN